MESVANAQQAHRARLERLLWQHTQWDKRHTDQRGVRRVWVPETGYVPVARLTDSEILALLPSEMQNMLAGLLGGL